MPVRIQLAVQGGGARLAVLLAALHAVQEMQDAQEIIVTRIAGTSAGAIAAAMLAARLRFDDIRVQLTNNKAALVKHLPPPNWRLKAKAGFGRAMVDIEPVKREFAAMLRTNGFTSFDDLHEAGGIPLIVIATDLRSNVPHTYKVGGQSIADAVFDSCALPFYFRGASRTKGESPLMVDGGICENLPADELLAGEAEYGPVLGISFENQGSEGNPVTPFSFGLALLSAAIDNSVRRAQRQIGRQRLVMMRTGLKLLDFQAGLDFVASREYNVAKEMAKVELQKILADLAPLPAPRPGTPSMTRVEGGFEEDSAVTLQRHADLYEHLHAHVPRRNESIRMLVRAEGLGDPNSNETSDRENADTLSYRLVFSAAVETVGCVGVKVTEGTQVRFQETFRADLVDRTGSVRKTIDLRARDQRFPDRRSYLLFPIPPIAPGDPGAPFTLDYSHQITNLFHRLLETGEDELGYTSRRSVDHTPLVQIIVVLPNAWAGCSMYPSPNTSSTDKGRALTPDEVRTLTHELALPAKSCLLAWVGVNIERDSTFAVLLRAPSSFRPRAVANRL